MSGSILVGPVVVFSQPDGMEGSQDDILVDSEISSSIVNVSKGSTFVRNGKSSRVLLGECQSIFTVSLHSSSNKGSEVLSGGSSVSINGSGIQEGRGVVKGIEDTVLSGTETLDGEDTSLVEGRVGFVERIVRFLNLDGIVGREVGEVEQERILAEIVGDHLGQGNKQVISSERIGSQSLNTFMEGVLGIGFEVGIGKDLVGHNSLIGEVGKDGSLAF